MTDQQFIFEIAGLPNKQAWNRIILRVDERCPSLSSRKKAIIRRELWRLRYRHTPKVIANEMESRRVELGL